MSAIAQIVVCKMVNSNITFSSNHATATFCTETAARQAALNLVNITKNSTGIDGKGYSVALAGHAQFLRKHTAARQWSSERIALVGGLFLPSDCRSVYEVRGDLSTFGPDVVFETLFGKAYTSL